MSEQSFPVTVAVRRPDGSVEQVRVGTAVRAGEGFSLTLGELAIGAVADSAAPARRAPAASGRGGGAPGGAVFPNYGRTKGEPIAGASMADLEFYANGCRRSLADPSKSRWHEKERALLAIIEDEIARQSGGGGGGGGGRQPDLDEARGSRGGPDFDDRPPPSDDDIPF